MKSTAKQVMSTGLITVKEQDLLSKAFKLMHENRIRHLPVVNSSGAVTGVISDRDILRASTSNIYYDDQYVFEDLKVSPHLLVMEYMTAPVEYLTLDTSIKVVAERMVKKKISSFLITDGKNLVGIITTEDLLRLLAHMIAESSPKWQFNLGHFLSNPIFGKISQTVSDAGI